MLALINSFSVDGLDYIRIYPDHQDPFLFYYFNTRPRVSVETETGTPLLSFMMIGRNVDVAVSKAGGNEDSAELQLGTLNMTTDLGLTENERTRIMNFLEKQVYDEAYRSRVKALYKDAGEILEKSLKEGRKVIVKLSPVGNCLSGTAKMELLEGLGDSFKRNPCADVAPALTGDFSSSFYASFGPEGSQLMYDALKSGYTEKGEKVTPTEAVVRYSLKAPAYVPPLKATLEVHMKELYEVFHEFQGEDTIIDSYTSSSFNLGKGVDGSFQGATTTGRVYLSEDDITKTINDSLNNEIGVSLIIENLSAFAEEKDAVSDQLISSLVNVVCNTVIPSLFESTPLSVSKEDGVVRPADPHKDDNSHTVTHMVYKLKDDFNVENTQDIKFEFTKASTMNIPLEANGFIISSIPANKVDTLVKIVDISDPLFSMLSIPVSVNAMFEQDNIFSVDVEVKYEQKDARTGLYKKAQKAYQFKKETDVFQFRAGLARDSEGKDLRTYLYRSRIVYRGQGSSIKDGNNTWTEWIPSDATSIVVSYEKLGFLKVQVQTADMDWDVIKEAVVSFEYPSGGGHPDCKTDIHLNQNNQIGSWTCYKWGSDKNEYTYQVRYVNKDGTEVCGKKITETKDILAINDLLTGRLTTSFDVIMSTKVAEKVKVEVVYNGKDGISNSYYHWFTGTDTWDLTFRLQEGAPESYRYRYLIIYQDGNTEQTDWKFGNNTETQTLTVNRSQTTPISLIVEGGAIDWSKWAFVYATAKYIDDAHGINESKTFRLTSASFFEQLNVTGYIGSIQPFLCSAIFVSSQGQRVEIPETNITNGLFMLENPKE